MEDKTFELLTKMYSEFSGKFDKMQGQMDNMQGKIDGIEDKIDGIEDKIDSIEDKIDNIEGDLKSLTNVVTRMENDHGNKLDALFDGYKQNSERLDRIEAQVSKQEEFIIKRVK